MADLLIGTTKGLFLADIDEADVASVRGPFCDGWPINHAIADNDQIWASGGGDWHGAGVWRSQDAGNRWTLSTDDFSEDSLGFKLHSIWSMARKAETLYAGSKPAHLFRSEDQGVTWDRLPALTEQPGAEDWFPGAAGLTLHTIVTSAQRRLYVGISAAGVFASDDGGETWRVCNGRIGPDGQLGPCDSIIDTCVHHIEEACDGRLYQQSHNGVLRSMDDGHSWQDINTGLPSRFGFPIAVHPDDPDMIWTIPLNGDSLGRYPEDAAAAVWRSSDGGGTWQALRSGLPQAACYFTVLRQAMCVMPDRALAFGTNTGSIFISRDNGESWTEPMRHLPTILSVEPG